MNDSDAALENIAYPYGHLPVSPTCWQTQPLHVEFSVQCTQCEQIARAIWYLQDERQRTKQINKQRYLEKTKIMQEAEKKKH